MKNIVNILLLAIFLLSSVAGCGKKGAIYPPNKSEQDFIVKK